MAKAIISVYMGNKEAFELYCANNKIEVVKHLTSPRGLVISYEVECPTGSIANELQSIDWGKIPTQNKEGGYTLFQQA